MDKAELRYIDGAYCITQGDKRIMVDDLRLDSLVKVRKPDGEVIEVENYTANAVFIAACQLNDLVIGE